MSDAGSQMIAGRYEVRARIGVSPATAVFLARDRELERDVAVKVLTPEFAGNPEVVEGFRRMAAIAAPLRAPAIVEVFDAGDSAEGPYLVMEHVDGASLEATLRAQPLTVERAAAMGASVAEALGAAHRAGAVHGSLTSRDVLLTRDGSVKVTDFGAASAGLAGVTESQVDAAVYGSPERLQGAPADAAGDLYALGVLLHEAVTGARPFGGSDAVAITREKLDRSPLPPSTTVPSVPPAYDTVVERLTSSTPSRRYRSAEEVAADLHRLTTPAARTAAIATTMMPAPVATPHRRRSNVGWIVAVIVLVLVIGGIVAWLALRDDGSTEQVTVPAVVGLPVLQAQSAIEQAGLRASTVNQAHPTVTAGQVFDQNPPGKSLADKGSEVRLSVSSGPPPTSSTSTSTTTTTTSTTTTTTTSTTTTTTQPTSTST